MLFVFNLYSALLLPGFIQGALFTVLAGRRAWREERLSDYLLSFLLLISTLYVASYMLGFAGWYDAHDWHTTFMFYFPWNHLLWVGPAVYLYFRSLTNTRFRIQRYHLWYFLPGALLFLTDLVVFIADLVVRHWWLGQELPYFYQTEGWWHPFSLPILDSIVFGLLWTYYFLFLTIREFGRYKRYVRNFFSDTEKIEFSWLRNLLVGFVIVLTLILVFGLVNDYVQELSYTQNWVKFFTVSIWIYYLSIAGYASGERVPPALQFRPEAPVPGEGAGQAAADEAELSVWKEKVARRMEKERPYLDPNLNLSDMADRLQTNASVLSRVINQGFEQNFNDFINRYRVEAVKERLRSGDGRQLTLLGIAMECGFNSKATFNRAFRKFTGQSPREYQRSIQEESG